MKRPRKNVEVIVAPNVFPPRMSESPRKDPLMSTRAVVSRKSESIDPRRESNDFRETMREVHALGSKLFQGRQKKDYEAERYKEITGRNKKQQRVPLKISRGIKKKAAVREARRTAEAKEAGIVIGSRKPVSNSRDLSKTSKLYGPVPSIGFTKKGVLSIRKPIG